MSLGDLVPSPYAFSGSFGIIKAQGQDYKIVQCHCGLRSCGISKIVKFSSKMAFTGAGPVTAVTFSFAPVFYYIMLTLTI